MKGWRNRYNAQRFPAPKLTELGGIRHIPEDKSEYDFSKPEDYERFLALESYLKNRPPNVMDWLSNFI